MSSRYLRINYELLPPHIREGFRHYIEDHQATGGFTRACLENDLMGAINRAGEVNLANIQDIVHFIYNEAPGRCHGSPEAVKAWRALEILLEPSAEERERRIVCRFLELLMTLQIKVVAGIGAVGPTPKEYKIKTPRELSIMRGQRVMQRARATKKGLSRLEGLIRQHKGEI